MSAEPNSFEDFTERFRSLQEEANHYGIISVSVLLHDDMLAQEEEKTVLHTGGHMIGVGMLEYGKAMMLGICGQRPEED